MLPVRFFHRSAEIVARELLGAVVVSRVGDTRTAGRIVETEAYIGYDDPASHGYRHHRSARNAELFGRPGNWYVYLSYGMHWCANLVAEAEGSGSAVLLRAVEPLEGLDMMRLRRGVDDARRLCAGPGRLCEALGISRSLDGVAMRSSEVVVLEPETAVEELLATPRIGITKAVDWPLRFVTAGSPWASRSAPASNRRGSSRGRSRG
jgi:DNA-3-methyladenine glycosylase